MKARLPVRSARLNHYAGRLVVGWVTTSESLLLIFFDFWLMWGCFSLFPFWLVSGWLNGAETVLK
jgi:hypothetical protein